MKVFRGTDTALRPADTHTFVGSARTALLASDTEHQKVHIYRVEFEPGSRTHWHVHAGPQWLIIVDGAIRVQCWGDLPRDVEAGDVVVIAPGEKHWHGAVPGASGVHLALNVNVTTEWLEPVSDEEYTART